MSNIGLDHSRWAGHQNRNTFTRGDWTCARCRARNYYWREICQKCSCTRNDFNPNWISSSVSELQEFSVPAARHHKDSIFCESSVQNASSSAHSSRSPSQGLDQSVWASRPRGSNNTQKSSFRQFPIHSLPKFSRHEQSLTPKILDSTLPYQVQHYIMAVMQKMLEEACYLFALRWIPKKLYDMRCDCPEAFELARWKSFLPFEVPRDAFCTETTRTVSSVLGDAVKIRNAAVHRHFCDNKTIMDMALQGEELMSILSDNTRREKFHHLWDEIGNWSEKNTDDPQTARLNLELAIQKVAEHPVDDMDWTPNSVLMMEACYQNGHGEPNDQFDEMEIDIL